MTSPSDAIDLRAHRLLDAWEREWSQYRTVTWVGDLLIAADRRTGEAWRASGHAELVGVMGLGIQS